MSLDLNCRIDVFGAPLPCFRKTLPIPWNKFTALSNVFLNCIWKFSFQYNFAPNKPKLPQLWNRFENNFRWKSFLFHGKDLWKQLIYYNSTENETQCHKWHLSTVKESFTAILLIFHLNTRYVCFVQKIKMSEIFFERYNFFRSESCGRPNRDLSATFQPRRPPHSSRTTRTSRRCERTYKISGGAHSVPKSKISTQPHKTHLDHNETGHKTGACGPF
jgi:hypothetical protein